MEKIQIESIKFTKLKGLHNVEIDFEKPLTAIMGVNGAGKTTVIHALACVYRPDDNGKGEDHHFPEFFVPNTDALWSGSEFFVVNKIEKSNNTWETQPVREYSKALDRWKPRYDKRPKRNVYYIGIDTCLPEIEKNVNNTRIQYTSETRTDKVSKKVLEAAAMVLNKDYSTLVDNTYNNRHFMGVATRSGLRYSSLSMGTGEQRTIKIMEIVMNAEAYSLILIDEIDLLLHVSALHRLVEKLYDISVEKQLQIVFTTHSLEMIQLTAYVGLRYINTIKDPDGTESVMVYKDPNDDIIREMTGRSKLPIKVFVEDEFSQTIIKYVLKKYGACRKTEIKKFGAAQNAFSVAAGAVLSATDLSNMLIIIDGDVYTSEEEQEKQINRVITGTEINADEKRKQALRCISHYALPSKKSPEMFVYELLLKVPDDNEITRLAREVRAVEDNHLYIGYICEQLQENVDTVMSQIISMIAQKSEWQEFIAPVEKWIEDHKDA